jgi:cytochrome c oxidase subunit 2
MDFTKLFPLPIVASSHGHEIDMMIYLVHLLMLVLFVGWGAFFVFTLVRFNKRANPKADYVGVKSHVSSYLEIAVAVIEAVLLIGFSIPFWAKHVNAFPNRPDKIEVRVNAEQFAWNIHYPGADGKFGRTSVQFFDKQSNPMGLDPGDPAGKDDITTINQLHLPIGRPAVIHLTSRDVMHSFSLPVMRVKQDAIPGLSIPTWFTPTMTGKWEIACAQLCGLGHYRMKGFLTIHSEEDFQAWLDEQGASSGGEGEEADDFWN